MKYIQATAYAFAPFFFMMSFFATPIGLALTMGTLSFAVLTVASLEMFRQMLSTLRAEHMGYHYGVSDNFKKMASINASIIVMILAAILPHFNITIGNDALTTMVQAVVEIVLGLYVYFTHKQLLTTARNAGVTGI